MTTDKLPLLCILLLQLLGLCNLGLVFCFQKPDYARMQKFYLCTKDMEKTYQKERDRMLWNRKTPRAHLIKKKNRSFSAKACTRLGEQGKEENGGHFLIELGP